MLGLFLKRHLITSLFVYVGSLAMNCDLQGQTISFLRTLGDPNEPEVPGAIAGDFTGIYIATSRTVAKYDSKGVEIWIRSFGAPLAIASAAALPSSGIYVTGSVPGSAQPGQDLPSANTFLRRYDSDGQELWTRLFGGPGPSNYALGVAADDTGAYVVASLSPSSSRPNSPYFLKYDPDGNELWRSALDIVPSGSQSIAINASGVYISGISRPTSPGDSPPEASTTLSKFDFNGALVWIRQAAAQSYPNPVTADASGVYLAVTDHRYNFVRKYDSDGTEVWTRTLAGKDASIFGLASDGNSLFVAGLVSLNLPGQCSAGKIDQFVSRYDRDGTEVWTRQFGTAEDDFLNGVALDSTGVYAIGSQRSSTTPMLVKLEKDTAPASDSNPRIRWECVLNAASYIGGAVAPGEIVTIFGTRIGPSPPIASPIGARIPTLLADTRVLFDGIAAPLLYTSAAQTTAIVPRAIEGKKTVDVQVEYLGVRSPAVPMPVVDSRIGIFTLDGLGDGQALTVNSDGTVNSSMAPAGKGSVISVYATGGGPTDGGLADDQARGDPAPKLAAPLYALLGTPGDDYADDGYFVEVIGAGEIAGSVEGLIRIDLRVPDSIPSGVWMLWISTSDPYARPYLSTLSTLGPQNLVTVAVR